MPADCRSAKLALPARFERATCGLGNRRSIHLSYGSKASKINISMRVSVPQKFTLAIQSCNLYGIFSRRGDQIKKSLRTTDKELARRRLEALRQKVARLNTKAGKAIFFADLSKRWLDIVSGMMKPSSRLRRETAINALKPYFTNTVRAIDKSQIDQWAASRNKTASARTFNIERETLIQILDYAMREGLILENPAKVTS